LELGIPAPVRCFHLTATVLSGEKHLTSARFIVLQYNPASLLKAGRVIPKPNSQFFF